MNFTIPRKTVVGVVGESGSGKSVTARSIIKLLPETATTSGAIYLSNRADSERLDVLSLSGEDLRRMRGSEAAMVFQEPNSVLNPVYTIGWQIEEGLRAHGMKDKKERRAKAIDILKKVGIPEAETRIDYYPTSLRRPEAAYRHRDGAGAQPRSDSSPTSRPPRST